MTNNRREQSRRYSHIGISSNSNFTYAMQYQRSYEILYKSDAPVDTIALPMLYSMRHYLELVLKFNIEYFHEFSGSRNMVGKSVHTLSSLSNAFKEHWSRTKKAFNITVDDKKFMVSFLELVNELEKIDDYAISFRYSHDREQNKNFDWLDTIDIYKLNGLFEETKILLDYSIDVFEDCTGLMNGDITKEELINQSSCQSA